jgi:hypothetical protein
VVDGPLDVPHASPRTDQDRDRQRVVEVGAEEAGADDVAADQRVGVEDPPTLMMSSAVTALSRLVLADCESEAPSTAIADTSAMPTISAAAVWAVRRGLRIEFSRPNLWGGAEQGGKRPSQSVRHRPRDDRRQQAGGDEHSHRAQPDERDRRCGQPRHHGGDATARREAADALAGAVTQPVLAVRDERGDGGDPARPAGPDRWPRSP